MTMTPVQMKVTKAGQISLPAEIRHRWKVERVLIVDHGDRIEVRPMVDDPIGAIRGKYKGLGINTDEMRAEARREEAEAEERMLRRMGR
ncbi:MAG TPA: AbrB/MazE/SpoVT family DNA-binding domain-containing protein [Iamia sp.]